MVSQSMSMLAIVKPLNKGHFGKNIRSAVVPSVERLSSSQRFKMTVLKL